MSLWCLFLDPRLTMLCSSIGVRYDCNMLDLARLPHRFKGYHNWEGLYGRL